MARPKPSDNEVRVIRNAQANATIRFFIGCSLIGWLGYQARLGIVKFTKKEPWESVAIAVITAIVTLLGPSVLIARYRIAIKKFTVRIVSRLAELEKQDDPGRSTSHMNPDGTDPEESHP